MGEVEEEEGGNTHQGHPLDPPMEMEFKKKTSLHNNDFLILSFSKSFVSELNCDKIATFQEVI